MRRDVTAGSSRQQLALYDRSGLPPDTRLTTDLHHPNPVPLSDGALGALVAQEKMLTLRLPPKSWKAALRVLVDEDPEPHVRQRAILVRAGARLAIPGGKLTADGVEFICREGQQPRYSAAEPFDVPAGEYQVDLLDLTRWKKQNRTAHLHERTTRLERVVGRFFTAAMWATVLVFPATLLAGPTLFVMARDAGGRRYADKVIGMVGLTNLSGLALFGALELASRRLPLLTRARHVRRGFEDENPDFVICFRRRNGTGGVVGTV